MRLYHRIDPEAPSRVRPHVQLLSPNSDPLRVTSVRMVLVWDRGDGQAAVQALADWNDLVADLGATFSSTEPGTLCLSRNAAPIPEHEALAMPPGWAAHPEQLLRTEFRYCAHWRTFLDAFPLSM